LIRQLVRVGLQQATKHINFVSGAFIRQPKKDHAMVRISFSIDLYSEVLVGNQYPVFFTGLLNNPVVVHTPRFVEDRKDVVLLIA
jgi:hypothetical protein